MDITEAKTMLREHLSAQQARSWSQLNALRQRLSPSDTKKMEKILQGMDTLLAEALSAELDSFHKATAKLREQGRKQLAAWHRLFGPHLQHRSDRQQLLSMHWGQETDA